ncbi:MAG: type IV pilus biogenesis/stability protein PilW, partial [Gammaproteobacteria bacterium HGW-Gammaproteobacteria-8]
LEDPFYQAPEVILANAGSCARRWGEIDRAERYLREALGYDPDFGEALFSMAELSHEQQRLLPARGFLQRLESLGPLSPEALLLAVRIERSLGNETVAREYADQLLRRYPGSAEAESLMRDPIEPDRNS